VEPVYLRREPQPAMEAVYYLTPCEASVDALIRDFDQEAHMYAAVHLIFTKRLPDDLLARLKQSAVKSKIRLLKELYLDYLACEQRVFQLDMQQALWNMYAPDAGNEKDVQLRRMADKLMTVLATLDQDPIIRFAAGHHLSNHLANVLREKLDAFKAMGSGWPTDSKKPRPLLLVLDRSYDMVSPFLHELTYQAMCQDLLPISEDVYTFETEAGKREVLLNENDILWPTLRHKHIADTSTHLIQSFRQFIASNAAVKFKAGDVNTLQDMSKVLRAMPEFQELREKFVVLF
jgi:hypothetical protein